MTQTYGDITVGTVWDGDVVTKREIVAPAAGEHAEIIRLSTRSGGRRTELASLPLDTLTLTDVRIAEPLLVDVPDDQLALGAGVFADQVRDGFEALLDGLHGCANEIHRRRALDCIERGCSRADDGCVCHTLPPARRFRRN